MWLDTGLVCELAAVADPDLNKRGGTSHPPKKLITIIVLMDQFTSIYSFIVLYSRGQVYLMPHGFLNEILST